MVKRSDMTHHLVLLVVALVSWIVPGGGHFLIKERKRAVIIFVTITSLFMAGLYVGSIAVIDSVGAWPWYIAQIMTTPAVAVLDAITRSGEYVSYGRCSDIGQIYTSIAGVLNLLCILSAVYMAHSGRGELIGEEEDA